MRLRSAFTSAPACAGYRSPAEACASGCLLQVAMRLGQDLEGALPRLVVEDLRRHHEFVCAGSPDEGVDAPCLTVAGEPTTAQDSAWSSIARAIGSSVSS